MKKNEEKKKCISCGKCHKKYCYLILAALIVNIFITVLTYLYFYIQDFNFSANSISFIGYLFFVNLGELLMIIPNLILKKNTFQKQDDISETKSSDNTIEFYIFNNNSIVFSRKEKILIIIFSIIKLILDISYIVYFQLFIDELNYIAIFNRSFRFELIILFFLSKYIYKIKLYKHQYCCVIILTIFEIANIIILYYDVDIKIILIHFFFNLIYSFFKSLMTLYIKALMDHKYFSPYKACYFYGMINLIPITIIYIIVSCIPCNSKNICLVEYNGDSYVGQILKIFSIPGIFMFLIMIGKALIVVLNYFTIAQFSVFHCFLLFHFSDYLSSHGPKNSDYYIIKGVINFILYIF